MTAPLYRAWTKAIRTKIGPPGYNARWIGARRAWFKVFADRVECGSLAIPAEQVSAAVLYESRQWFIPVTVLSITTSDSTWQFGFNPWANVAPHLPFSFRREQVRLRYSVFSLILRVILLGYLVYWLIQRFDADQ